MTVNEVAGELVKLLEDDTLSPEIRRRIEACVAAIRGRYTQQELIATGGMAEVWAVHDPSLLREVAMKALLVDGRIPRDRARELERWFRQEMIVAPQLQHPAIVPVHDVGELPDGRPFLTLKRVRGGGAEQGRSRTLTDAIREVHAAVVDARWEPAPSGWTFHRLVAAFARVCEAVAYAHTRGVLHLDLKPGNVLVGDFGEVGLVDWGIARVVEPAPGAEPVTLPDPVPWRQGVGTAEYMSPEQAEGREPLTRASDVYSLGAILYEILAGRPPYQGSRWVILDRIKRGVAPTHPGRLLSDELPGTTYGYGYDEPEPPVSPLVPRALDDIRERAMRRDPGERYASAADVRADVEAWLDGSKRRTEALARVEEARAMQARLDALRIDMEGARTSARQLFARLPAWAPMAEKQPGWDLEREAETLDQELTAATLRFVQLLHAAIIHVPDLVEAHELLGDHYLAEHRRALAARDRRAAATAEALLRAHDVGRHAVWLSGRGHLDVTSADPALPLVVRRWTEGRDRRVHLGEPVLEAVGTISEASLPEGSYTVEVGGRVCYPVAIERASRWSAVPPEGGPPLPIRLPGPLRHGEIFIPAGWFLTGGPSTIPGAGAWRRVWVEDFVIQRDPITNAEYIAFLDDLVRRGRAEEALEHAPRTITGQAGARGAQMYGRRPDGSFFLQTDAQGHAWLPDWPVLHVSWDDARAYAAWWTERTGEGWRLPLELEWEKAARGVDGRMFPWGDAFDATWARTRESHPHPVPLEVGEHTEDVGPYGVRGMAGNVRDWCLDWWRPDGPTIVGDRPVAPAPTDPSGRRVIRGGAWASGVNYAHLAARDGDDPRSCKSHVGFRLVSPRSRRDAMN